MSQIEAMKALLDAAKEAQQIADANLENAFVRWMEFVQMVPDWAVSRDPDIRGALDEMFAERSRLEEQYKSTSYQYRLRELEYDHACELVTKPDVG